MIATTFPTTYAGGQYYRCGSFIICSSRTLPTGLTRAGSWARIVSIPWPVYTVEIAEWTGRLTINTEQHDG